MHFPKDCLSHRDEFGLSTMFIGSIAEMREVDGKFAAFWVNFASLFRMTMPFFYDF
jgi:hypothetical protein